jgi:hypothetical protein
LHHLQRHSWATALSSDQRTRKGRQKTTRFQQRGALSDNQRTTKRRVPRLAIALSELMASARIVCGPRLSRLMHASHPVTIGAVPKVGIRRLFAQHNEHRMLVPQSFAACRRAHGGRLGHSYRDVDHASRARRHADRLRGSSSAHRPHRRGRPSAPREKTHTLDPEACLNGCAHSSCVEARRVYQPVPTRARFRGTSQYDG